MNNYLQYMSVLLFFPFLIACYVYSPKNFFGLNEKHSKSAALDNRASAVWILFAFLVSISHANFGNNAAKWDLCSILESHIGTEKTPSYCRDLAEVPDYE